MTASDVEHRFDVGLTQQLLYDREGDGLDERRRFRYDLSVFGPVKRLLFTGLQKLWIGDQCRDVEFHHLLQHESDATFIVVR